MSISVHLDQIKPPPAPRTAKAQDGAGAMPGAPLRVLMASRYGRLGASSRLRLLQYAPVLARFGISATPCPFLSDRYVEALYQGRSRMPSVIAAYAGAARLRAQVQAHDVIWVEKELLPFLPVPFERAILGPDKRFILDFDDAWFLRYGAEGDGSVRNRLLRLLLGGKFPALLRRAALTIVANETLRDWAIRAGASRVLLLPTVVDLDHYPVRPEPSGIFTIGWIGTPVTAPYLARLAAPLRALAHEAPMELLIVGAPDFSIAGVRCRHLPWSEATEAAALAQCHVGVMPLPDDAWARGKAGYKLIQSMAAGRPTIGSPVGANSTIVQDGVTGFLASDDAAWLVALRRLRDDPPLRAAMGRAARARVEAQFSLQATAPELAEAIRGIAG